MKKEKTPEPARASLDRISILILALVVCCIGLGFLMGFLARGAA